MKTRFISLIFAVLAVSMTAGMPRSIVAQSAPMTDIVLTDQLRSLVVDSVISFVRHSYLDSITGEKAAVYLTKKRDRGAFAGITLASKLCDSLTACFQSVQPDKHFRVVYDTAVHPFGAGVPSPMDTKQVNDSLDAEYLTAGVFKVERLQGNVGYIKLFKFFAPTIVSPVLAAAMKLVSSTDALIIDLSENGGGYGETVEEFLSYFLPSDPVHLMDDYDRSSVRPRQRWSLASVPGPRYLGKDVYILIGPKTFSAAEAFAYLMQALGRATIVGQTSRGGAHPVNIFLANEHFGVLMPIMKGVCPITGGDWEGVGVKPQIVTSDSLAVTTAQLAAVKGIQKKRPRKTPDVDYSSIVDMLESRLSKMKEQSH